MVGTKRIPPLTGNPDIDKVIKLRLVSGLSNAEIGKLVGATEATVRRWATGIRNPSGAAQILLNKLAEEYKIENADIQATAEKPKTSGREISHKNKAEPQSKEQPPAKVKNRSQRDVKSVTKKTAASAGREAAPEKDAKPKAKGREISHKRT